MTQDVSGVVAKLTRAFDLLNQLEGMTFQYLMDKPYDFDVTFDRPKMQYTVVVNVKPTPSSYAVMFGEVLHDLRSVLDHTARLLVQAGGREPVDGGPRKTTFPIFKTEPAGGVDIAPGLSQPVRDVLDAVQPYNATDPEKHLLWRLHQLNNIDKHRLLHVTGLSGNRGAAFVPAPLEPERPTTQEQRRHTIRLVPDIKQVFDVTEESV